MEKGEQIGGLSWREWPTRWKVLVLTSAWEGRGDTAAVARQATTVVSGALTWWKILGRLRGEKSSSGLVKSWQTGGSVGSRSAMKSQTQGKYLLKPRFAPPEGTEGSLFSSFVLYFFCLFGCSVVLFQYYFWEVSRVSRYWIQPNGMASQTVTGLSSTVSLTEKLISYE